MMRRFLPVLVLSLFVFATPAIAQPRRTAPPPRPSNDPTFGVRAGVSGDPDQFYFGGHVETAPLIEHVTFRPNLELGVGDDATLIAFNFELVYSIPLKNQPWRVYLGAGPALIIESHHDESDVGGGLNFVLGLQHRKGLFTELKVGAIDSPTIKFCVGYVFH